MNRICRRLSLSMMLVQRLPVVDRVVSLFSTQQSVSASSIIEDTFRQCSVDILHAL